MARWFRQRKMAARRSAGTDAQGGLLHRCLRNFSDAVVLKTNDEATQDPAEPIRTVAALAEVGGVLLQYARGTHPWEE
jgi:hypothetical protein